MLLNSYQKLEDKKLCLLKYEHPIEVLQKVNGHHTFSASLERVGSLIISQAQIHKGKSNPGQASGNLQPSHLPPDGNMVKVSPAV